MRLHEVERGDSTKNRILIRMISMISRMRLPDAARFAFYHADFGGALASWTHTAMRGPSSWSVGERELMAATVSSWNSSRFCKGAHRAVAIKQLPVELVDASIADYRTGPISDRLKATLAFLEKMTLRPAELTPEDARAALDRGVSPKELEDAIAVASVFNMISRYSDALDFAIPTADEYSRAANMLLKRGYAAR